MSAFPLPPLPEDEKKKQQWQWGECLEQARIFQIAQDALAYPDQLITVVLANNQQLEQAAAICKVSKRASKSALGIT